MDLSDRFLLPPSFSCQQSDRILRLPLSATVDQILSATASPPIPIPPANPPPSRYYPGYPGAFEAVEFDELDEFGGHVRIQRVSKPAESKVEKNGRDLKLYCERYSKEEAL